MAIVGGLVLVAEGVAGVVDQANPCGLAAGLGLSNAGLGPAYILVVGGFRLVCGRLVCAGHVPSHHNYENPVRDPQALSRVISRDLGLF